MGTGVSNPPNLRWYAIHTHLNHENRAYANLNTLEIEIFYPKIKELRRNEFSGAVTYVTKPFFPRYLFARFDAEQLLHKVWFTRGVESVVSFGGNPTSVDEKVIDFIKSRTGDDGFVEWGNEKLKPGDEVVMKSGTLGTFIGIFERELKGSERVMILLQAINYQGHMIVERDLVRKVR